MRFLPLVSSIGLRPNMCRPAADGTKLPVAQEKKPLVRRVIEQVSVMRGLTVILFLNKKTSSNKRVSQF